MMKQLALAGFLLANAWRASAQAPGSIAIERVEPGRWRATYEFSEPVTSLRFARGAGNHRERYWRVVTPGYAWGIDGDRVVLRLEAGRRPERRIVMDFPQLTAPLPKEYELFQPFSDGAVALYTGHFYARPTGPAYPANAPVVQTIRITPPDGAHAVVRGRVVLGAVTFTDSLGDGTYIYMGRARPIETPHLVAIVDPGMPEWLRGMFHQRLPELFAAYAQRFGAPLPSKPVVLYSFHDTASAGYSSGGGTLTGLINMTVTGTAWRTQRTEAAAQAFYLLAHEAAHLWNGQLISSEGGRGSWMHEGSADAFANDMLLAFGLVSQDEWKRTREAAINNCAVAVADAPVHRAAERGLFRAYYDCGFVLSMWTEAATKRGSQRGDLFAFWRSLIPAAQARGGRYGEPLYFATARNAGATADAIAAMQAFLDAGSIEPAIRGLAAAGVAVAPGEGRPPRAFEELLARQAFGHVMRAACNGRMSFNYGDPIVTLPVPECPLFNQSRQVFGLQGYRLADQAADAYDAVAAACAAAASVRVQGRGGQTLVAMPCRTRLEPRPRWYRLQ